jgi:broad specificity phosphatase PhoE/ubiquinone/menaquinone biosynthesis C-methylase UbiE
MGTTEPQITHILLVRHGQSLYNRDGASRATESGLTELGWQQAQLVADWLGRSFTVDALVCSGQIRARQTAEVIGQQLGLRPAVMAGFNETQLPYWSEFPSSPDDPLAWWDHPWQADATSAPLYTEFRQGLRSAVAALMRRCLGQTVVVVSHGGTIGTIVRSLCGGHQMPIFTENCGVTHLVWQEGRWRLVSHNERAHLGDAALPAALPWADAGPTRVIVEHYRRVAEISTCPPAPAVESQLRALRTMVAPRPGDSLLDVGAGAAVVALAFAPHLAHATAIDISPAMLECAEVTRLEHGVANVDIRWANAIALPYDRATFDIVACRDLCRYIPDLSQLFGGLHTIARPGGKLALDELIGSENPVKRATHQALEMQRDPAVARLYSESEIEQRIREAGFRIERAETYDTSLDLDRWLADSALEEGAQSALDAMMRASIEGDPAGLRIQRGKNGGIHFTQRRLRLLARAANR